LIPWGLASFIFHFLLLFFFNRFLFLILFFYFLFSFLFFFFFSFFLFFFSLLLLFSYLTPRCAGRAREVAEWRVGGLQETGRCLDQR
jgi:hypothetical protein